MSNFKEKLIKYNNNLVNAVNNIDNLYLSKAIKISKKKLFKTNKFLCVEMVVLLQ